jgi:type II secretory pathway predicted ATPase ExeA
MYLEHFKLRELPFRLSPDPAFLYPSQSHSRAKAYMESTIWFTDGFVIITGEIGSGKTTLIETFLKELVQDEVVAQLNQTQISPIEFLQTLLAQFGYSPFRMRKAELLATLNNFLIEQHAAGRKVLLIIDEAQNLSDKVLEEVRLLSGVETTKEKVLRIILAGQPELNQKLDSPELVQLKQRVRLRFHLGALNEQEMGSYIRHRLDVAGAEGREIFAPDTYPQIYRYTGGIPRLINTLCDTAMMEAFAKDIPEVSMTTLNSAIAELQWQEYASGTHTNLPVSELDDTSPHLRLPVGRIVLSLKGVKIDEAALLPGRFVIGRTPDNDMQVESKFVSRHHAQLITTPGGTVVEDLNSTNGVYLNGKRVRRHRLVAGDVIKLGVHEITYKSPDFLAAHDEAHATETTVLGHDSGDDEDEEDGLESVGERDDTRADGDAEEPEEAGGARSETYSSRARGS